MHGENEWTEKVSPLENAIQWKAMLDAGVSANQSALAVDLGCHRGTVSRAVRTATVLFEESWIERPVWPVMHEFSGRLADRLADALADPVRRRAAKRRAAGLMGGEVPTVGLYEALVGDSPWWPRRETVFVRRKGRAGGGMVAGKIERDGAGGFSVSVRPHEQTEAESPELAEQIEALLAAETAVAAGVGRKAAGNFPDVPGSEGRGPVVARRLHLVCSAGERSRAVSSGDRWRCAAVADVLRSQPDGWEKICRGGLLAGGRRSRLEPSWASTLGMSRVHDKAIACDAGCWL